MQTQQLWHKPIKLIVFFNHTSLYEPLFIALFPIHFIYKLAHHMLAPGADKTLDRPIVGIFWKLFAPYMVKITRKRDHTWQAFIDQIKPESIIIIAAEGRMKRLNGLDVNGKKMTVRGGVVDIINLLDSGEMLFSYSGGLHHVQAPGQFFPRLFKTISMKVELVDIKSYRAQFTDSKSMLADLQSRLETHSKGGISPLA